MQLSLLEKIGFSFMLAAWIAWGSNLIGNALVYAEPLQVAAFKIEGGSGAASGTAEKPPAEQAAGGSDISALLASADAPPDRLPFAIAEYVARHDLELHTHASAEAQVAALSDDIAYVNHDLHDGLRAGLFTIDEAMALPLVGDCFAEVDAAYPGLESLRRRHEALRRVFGLMVDDVLAESRHRLEARAPATMAEVQALDDSVITFSGRMAGDIEAIKSFLFRHMYRHYKVRRMRNKATGVVRDLFDIFHNDSGLMPEEWSDAAAAAGSEELRARIVADYIAGMTDRFALEEHRVLTDPSARA